MDSIHNLGQYIGWGKVNDHLYSTKLLPIGRNNSYLRKQCCCNDALHDSRLHTSPCRRVQTTKGTQSLECEAPCLCSEPLYKNLVRDSELWRKLRNPGLQHVADRSCTRSFGFPIWSNQVVSNMQERRQDYVLSLWLNKSGTLLEDVLLQLRLLGTHFILS